MLIRRHVARRSEAEGGTPRRRPVGRAAEVTVMPRHRSPAGLRLLPVVLALFVCGRPAVAQTPDTIRLSLAEAVRRAAAEGEEIQAARAQLAQADAQVTQATAAALPHVGTAFSYNRTIRSIFDALALPPGADTSEIPLAYDETRTPNERYDTMSELLMQDFMAGLISGLPFGRRNTYVAMLQVTQPIFAGGRIRGARNIAEHLGAAAEARLEETTADLVLAVRVAYLNALLAERLHTVALQSRQTAQDHLRQVEAFRAAGTASEFDLLRAKVDAANREPFVVQTENTARVALLDLRRLVNLPAEQPVVLTSTFSSAPVRVDEAEVRRLMAARPLLAAARAQVAATESGLGVAKGEWFPTVAVQGNLGYQAYPNNFGVPALSEWREDWSVAVAVSWIPFDGFGRRGRIAEAQARLREAQLREAQVVEALDLQYTAALGDYRTAEANVAARREAVGLAEQTLELGDLRYRNGLATQLEVSDASLLLDEARVNEIEALAAYVTALAQIERLAGGRLALLTEVQP
jgi:outer membrane protein TolC